MCYCSQSRRETSQRSTPVQRRQLIKATEKGNVCDVLVMEMMSINKTYFHNIHISLFSKGIRAVGKGCLKYFLKFHVVADAYNSPVHIDRR